MKELQPHISDKTEVVRQIEKKNQFVGDLRVVKGMTCWQLDLITKEITVAKFDKEIATIGKIGPKTIRNINAQTNCLYTMALNAQNADRKFHKALGLKFKKPK